MKERGQRHFWKYTARERGTETMRGGWVNREICPFSSAWWCAGPLCSRLWRRCSFTAADDARWSENEGKGGRGRGRRVGSGRGFVCRTLEQRGGRKAADLFSHYCLGALAEWRDGAWLRGGERSAQALEDEGMGSTSSLFIVCLCVCVLP